MRLNGTPANISLVLLGRDRTVLVEVEYGRYVSLTFEWARSLCTSGTQRSNTEFDTTPTSRLKNQYGMGSRIQFRE